MEIPAYFYLNILAIALWLALRKRFRENIDIIGYYMMFCFISESAAWLYSFYSGKSNHWCYNIFTTFQILYLSYIYNQIISRVKQKNVIRYFAIVYPMVVIFNILLIQSFNKFHTYTYILGGVFVVLMIIWYFNRILESDEDIGLRRNPFFWFNVGNMIYFIGSMFYMGSINYILAGGHDFYGELIVIFVYSFTSIQYCCYIIASLCNLRRVN